MRYLFCSKNIRYYFKICLMSWCLMLNPSLFLQAAPDLKLDLDVTLDKPYGGTLRWGIFTKPQRINPILLQGDISSLIVDLIFNKLVRITGEGEIVSDLAESWKISEDGFVYTFYLKKGVKFHDGVELTAEDVLFTFQRMMDPEVDSFYASKLAIVKEWKVVDRYTIRAYLKEPQTYFLAELKHLGIVPKHILEGEDLKTTAFNQAPIGTGPFTLINWPKDNQITLHANPDYFEGRPNLDQIIFKPYPDINATWAAFMRNEVDIGPFLSWENFEIVSQDPSFQSFSVISPGYYALAYNLRDPLLSDKKIRYALAYAINEKALIDQAQHGYGTLSVGPVLPTSWGFNPDVIPMGYDPLKAKTLLREAGWEEKEGLFFKERKPLTLELSVWQKDDVHKKIALLIRQQLQEVGIKLKIRYFDDYSKLISHEKENPSFQVLLSAFHVVVYDPGMVLKIWHSNFPKGARIWGYKNLRIDQILDKANKFQDRTAKAPLYQEAHQLIYEDQPQCFLFFPHVFFAMQARFQGIEEFFTPAMPRYTIKDWWIDDEDEKEK